MKLRASPDGWGPLYPRRWQGECLGILLRHYSARQPTPAAIQCIMGSGKSKLLAQFLQHVELEGNEAVVVSTSSIYLVEQLMETFRDRLDPRGFELATGTRVGSYYTHGKDLKNPIIVACTNSVPELAAALQQTGRPVALWAADEAHRTRCPTIDAAKSTLNATRILGMSATCHRASDEERLTLFQKLLYRYGAADAIRDGKVVVPWRIVPWSGGEAKLDDACIQMTNLSSGPGVFSAMSIEDAEQFADKLTKAEMPALAVHSKLSRTAIKQRLESLRKGELKAIVHVAMLQEGVDFPWLRWLCLRRPVASRVRFAQEVGRSLRYYRDPQTGEEKSEAVLYDPHGLFELHRLEYNATLGGEYEVDAPDEPEDEAERMDQELAQALFDLMGAFRDEVEKQVPVSVGPLAAYLTELIVAMDTCHLLPSERVIAGRSWRRLEPTAKQLGTIGNMRWVLQHRKCIPPNHKDALGILIERASTMNRGVASDMISVLKSLADVRKWPDLKHIDRAVNEAVEKHRAVFVPLAQPAEAPQQRALPVPPVQGVLFPGAERVRKRTKKPRAYLGRGPSAAPLASTQQTQEQGGGHEVV